MNNLVIMKNQQAVTTSLQVADVFKKEHRHILEAIDRLQKDVPNFRQMFVEGSEPDSYGRDRRIYYMNRDGFTVLAMGFTGKQALKFKLKYIDAFNQMEKQVRESGGFNVPTSLPEALRLAANQAEQLEKMKPKALFADAVAVSHTAILVGDLAKLLRGNGVDIGANRLFSWLRGHGYLISGHRMDRNMPTQRSMDLGLFKVKETVINHSDGHTSISKTPKVTGKGQAYFINKFLKERGYYHATQA